MPQEFVIVKEIIASGSSDSFDVHSTVKTSPEIFQELFGVEYPSGLKKGDIVAKVPIGSINLTVVFGQEVEMINNVRVVTTSPMTLGSWTLWKLLSDHGFKLLDSRIWLTRNDESIFNGRQLAERVFVRDI